MKRRFVFQPEARSEFIEAIAWYEEQVSGLGREFAREVMEVLEVARAQPERFPTIRGRARRIRLKRFRAYGIYFAIKEDVFSVISVFHGARNPTVLLRRLS